MEKSIQTDTLTRDQPHPRLEFDAIERAIKYLRSGPNVSQPIDWELRRTAERFASITQFGNLAVHSTVRNRSARLTTYIGSPAVQQPDPNPSQQAILKRLPDTLARMEHYLRQAPFVRVDRTMGDNGHFAPDCTLFVSVQRPEMIRLAYMTWSTLFPPRTDGRRVGPAQTMIYIPEWMESERQMLVFPEINATVALGSDYYGESKKGFLRLMMWNAKQRGMLGLHAGSKILSVKDRDGRPRRYGMLIFGMSGTGKTTHTCHLHGLTGDGEGIEILQDDVVMLGQDGSAIGTERGFYLKTEGLDPVSQPIIYKAATSRNAIFENVMINHEGRLDFEDEVLTSNGRGIMMREDLEPYISGSIDLPPAADLDGLIVAFITRRHTIVPLAAKLTPEQAAACFMLGESIETYAGDPKPAGESNREVGT
ncbi:MAG: phosphoenolpyruvate carboxykinase (ATP), partial [Acidobacteria bacterium]|nr:phosphoenolpyruvate carboxykinase (ATP) [Acidobacteriota bacterium]